MSAAHAIIEQTTDLQPVQQNEVAAIIQVIERAAMNPNVDIDKMERLLQMQERVIERNAKAAFNAAFARMQPDLPAIEKNGKSNNGTYGLWEDIQGGIQPVLAKHGFALSFKTKVEQDAITVTAILHHEEGHDDSTDLKLPTDKSGSKIAVQAVGSSVSYGKRYAACPCSISVSVVKMMMQPLLVRSSITIWKRHTYGEEAVRTFEEAALSYLEQGGESRFLPKVLKFFKGRAVGSIKPAEIRQMAIAIYPTGAPRTRNRQAIAPARAVINHAHDLGWCGHIKVKQFEVPKSIKHKPVDHEWLDAFLAEADKSNLHHLSALVIFMNQTGTRVSEAIRLTGKYAQRGYICKISNNIQRSWQCRCKYNYNTSHYFGTSPVL